MSRAASRVRRTSGAGALLACVLACSGEEPGLYRDVTAERGLAGRAHFAGFTPRRYLVETMGGGVGLLDHDLDGRLDVYQVQSAPLPGGEVPAEPPVNRLFRNAGARFEEVDAGVGDPGFGMGCASGDVEGDGDPDLLVLNFGANVFYRNAGDGTFDDASLDAGLADERWSVCAGFFDADRDGDLDVYVVNYLVFSTAIQDALFAGSGVQPDAYPHPDRFDAAADAFLINDGSGRFVDQGKARGLYAPLPGKGLGIGLSDIDLDGDTDVYVANDSTPNFLFRNDGSGHFEEVAALTGCAFNRDGTSEASMGVDIADATGDGRGDVFITHLDIETNTFYQQTGDTQFLEFRDRTAQAGLATASHLLTGFGTGFTDFDADGDLDLFVANGDLHDQIEELMPGRTYAQPDKLFENLGNGEYRDVSASGGSHFARRLVGRGAAFGDLDNDGDTDIVIGNSGADLTVLENRATAGHWLRLRLAGGEGNPADGQGARVVVEAGGRTLSRELFTARSYASASEAMLFFGLGPATAVDRVTVHWPSGRVDEYGDLAVDRRWSLPQGLEARGLTGP